MAHILTNVIGPVQDAEAGQLPEVPWRIRVDGQSLELTVTAARCRETSATVHGPVSYTFFSSAGEVVFQAPRERVLYVRRVPASPALTPCKPSREGGMCGCDEPDDGPVIRLPAHMAEEGGYQIVRIGAGFTEVFPGLELAVFLSPDDQGRVTAHFRLTPPDDGQEHD